MVSSPRKHCSRPKRFLLAQEEAILSQKEILLAQGEILLGQEEGAAPRAAVVPLPSWRLLDLRHWLDQLNQIFRCFGKFPGFGPNFEFGLFDGFFCGFVVILDFLFVFVDDHFRCRTIQNEDIKKNKKWLDQLNLIFCCFFRRFW